MNKLPNKTLSIIVYEDGKVFSNEIYNNITFIDAALDTANNKIMIFKEFVGKFKIKAEKVVVIKNDKKRKDRDT